MEIHLKVKPNSTISFALLTIVIHKFEIRKYTTKMITKPYGYQTISYKRLHKKWHIDDDMSIWWLRKLMVLQLCGQWHENWVLHFECYSVSEKCNIFSYLVVSFIKFFWKYSIFIRKLCLKVGIFVKTCYEP